MHKEVNPKNQIEDNVILTQSEFDRMKNCWNCGNCDWYDYYLCKVEGDHNNQGMNHIYPDINFLPCKGIHWRKIEPSDERFPNNVTQS